MDQTAFVGALNDPHRDDASMISSWRQKFSQAEIDWKRMTAHASDSFWPGLHLNYFSCRKHFEYLRYSLRSLSLLQSVREIDGVWLWIDPEDPLSSENMDELRTVSRYPIRFGNTAMRMSRSGLNVVFNEVSAFFELYRELGPGVVFAKVDSDMLFVSGEIFKRAELMDTDSILGHRFRLSASQSPYVQGGCYFIRSRTLPYLLKRSATEGLVDLVVSLGYRLDHCPEDRVITGWIESAGGSVGFKKFQLDVDKIADLQAAISGNVAGLSAIHFQGNLKGRMKETLAFIERFRACK